MSLASAWPLFVFGFVILLVMWLRHASKSEGKLEAQKGQLEESREQSRIANAAENSVRAAAAAERQRLRDKWTK